MKIQGSITVLLMLALVSACGGGSSSGSTNNETTNPESFPITDGGNTETGPVVVVTPTPGQPSSGTTPSLVSTLGIHASVDLRAYDSPVTSQFGGTCSTFATAAAMNNMLKQKGYNKEVSERHLWSLYGVYDMDYAVSAAKKNYVTEAKYWPVNGTKQSNFASFAGLKLTETVQHNYNMESALQGLSKGHPLIMAIQVPADLSNCKVNIAANSAYTSGQHVVEAVGYQLDDSVSGGGYFIVKNSWGSTCGDKGYHYFPFGICKRSNMYCYFAEVVNVESKFN